MRFVVQTFPTFTKYPSVVVDIGDFVQTEIDSPADDKHSVRLRVMRPDPTANKPFATVNIEWFHDRADAEAYMIKITSKYAIGTDDIKKVKDAFNYGGK